MRNKQAHGFSLGGAHADQFKLQTNRVLFHINDCVKQKKDISQ